MATIERFERRIVKMSSVGKRIVPLIVALILVCAAGAADQAKSLQTIDILEVTKTGSALESKLSRRIGVGMDAQAKTTFGAKVVDLLPVGCRLLSPGPCTTEVRGLDGRKHPVTLSSKSTGQGTELSLVFVGLPALPQGEKCCGCSGGCGRACSIEYTYYTTCGGDPTKWGDLSINPVPVHIPVKKSSKVSIAVKATKVNARDTVVVITIPAKAGGADIRVKSYSTSLRVVGSGGSGSIRLATKRGVGNTKLSVTLLVTPSGPGKIMIPGFAELAGRIPQHLRTSPAIVGQAGTPQDHQTYLRVRQALVLVAK